MDTRIFNKAIKWIQTKWVLSKEIDDNLVCFFNKSKANLFDLLCPDKESEKIT
jgi:hypothetical protein